MSTAGHTEERILMDITFQYPAPHRRIHTARSVFLFGGKMDLFERVGCGRGWSGERILGQNAVTVSGKCPRNA